MSADLLVFAAYGIFGVSAITALTVQSTMGVERVETVSPTLLKQTLESLEGDLPPAGVKIGMLATAGHVEVVAEYLKSVRLRRELHVVLDPVIRSSSGAALLDGLGVEALVGSLLPHVDAITPNLLEAEALSGLPCHNRQQMEAAARALRQSNPGLAIVITGGHLPQPADLLILEDGLQWYEGEHIATRATHGTGCVFSSALLANRLLGQNWNDATAAAKHFVADAMRRATPRGQGQGPLSLF